MKKNDELYKIILGTWIVLVLLTLPFLLYPLKELASKGNLAIVLGSISTLFILYFWINGVKDVVYTLFYWINKKKIFEYVGHYRIKDPFVYMLYATCNDFDKRSLLKSMKQQYRNFEVVILDDSSDAKKKAEIDEFADEHNLRVIRRGDRRGFKAGNLNNFLMKNKCDYFVILDSDEVVPANFISRALDYFVHYKNAGIVQGNHIATRNRNAFMKEFAKGVNSHWGTYQGVKNKFGFMSLLGHGAMVKHSAYIEAGGFPELVAEDLCLAIEMRNIGYFTVFAPDIVCEEEFPVSYLAFKKRHSKWTQGNMEFIKKYSLKILMSKMTWFEKLDIFLFCYNLPLTAIFALYIVINVIFLPLLDAHIDYTALLLIPTIIFLIAPTLNDIIYYRGKMSNVKLIQYLIFTFLLFGSMFYASFKASLTSIFGKAIFVVTPKRAERMSFTDAIEFNTEELIFGMVLAGIAILIDESILPVLLIIIPSFASVFLTMMHQTKKELNLSYEII